MKLDMNAIDLKYLMDVCKLSIDKTSARPALGMIACKILNNESMIATALDGYRLHSVTVPCEVIEGDTQSMILIPLIKVPPKTKHVIIEIFESEVIYDFITSKQVIKIDDNLEFPNVNQIIPKDNPDFSIYVNPKFMEDAFKAFRHHETVKIEFFGKVNPIIVKYHADYALVLPKKINEAKY